VVARRQTGLSGDVDDESSANPQLILGRLERRVTPSEALRRSTMSEDASGSRPFEALGWGGFGAGARTTPLRGPWQRPGVALVARGDGGAHRGLQMAGSSLPSVAQSVFDIRFESAAPSRLWRIVRYGMIADSATAAVAANAPIRTVGKDEEAVGSVLGASWNTIHGS